MALKILQEHEQSERKKERISQSLDSHFKAQINMTFAKYIFIFTLVSVIASIFLSFNLPQVHNANVCIVIKFEMNIHALKTEI